MNLLRLLLVLPMVLALGAAPHMRIVSLMPSLTEDLFALGAGPDVVAVSQADDYPPSVTHLPRVASFSTVNNEAIVQLHPDLVLGIPSQERLTGSLRASGVHAEFLRDDTFDDIFFDIEHVGRLTGRSAVADRLVRALRAQTQRLAHSTHFMKPPRVLVVVNATPTIVAGSTSYIARLIEYAGGINAAPATPEAYPTLSAEAVLASQPDLIITDTQTQLEAVRAREPWRSLRAVHDGRTIVMNRSVANTIERPGPRYNAGISWLIAHLRSAAK